MYVCMLSFKQEKKNAKNLDDVLFVFMVNRFVRLVCIHLIADSASRALQENEYMVV